MNKSQVWLDYKFNKDWTQTEFHKMSWLVYKLRLFCECDCDKKWVVWMSMILFIWCKCDVFVCTMLQKNGFHTHSVRLWYVIPIPICIYTDHSRTVWTNSLKSQEKLSKNVAKEISRTCEGALRKLQPHFQNYDVCKKSKKKF